MKKPTGYCGCSKQFRIGLRRDGVRKK